MPPSLPKQIQAIVIVQPVRDWCQQHPVQVCVLFGSQAIGKPHPQSDVDLVLNVKPLYGKRHGISSLWGLAQLEGTVGAAGPYLHGKSRISAKPIVVQRCKAAFCRQLLQGQVDQISESAVALSQT